MRKTTLRALGVGIFLSGAILACQPYLPFEKEQHAESKKIEQLTAENKQLKLQLAAITPTKKETEKETKKETKSAHNTGEKAETKTSDASASASKSDTSTSKEIKSTFKLHVTQGMDSTKITDALEKGGVVEDARDFENYIKRHGKESKLLIGTYTIEKGSSYAHILKILTKSS